MKSVPQVHNEVDAGHESDLHPVPGGQNRVDADQPGDFQATDGLDPLINRGHHDADRKGDPEQGVRQKCREERLGGSVGDPCRGRLDSQGHSIAQGGGRQAPENRGNHGPVVIYPLCALADQGQNGRERFQGDILRDCPHLGKGHRHSRELRVDFVGGRQHGIFHDRRSDLAFGGHFPDFPDRDTQVVGDRLNDGRGLFEDAVQFFTAKDAGRHGLGQLQHSRVDTGGRCSGNRELFVDQFGKGDQFFVAGKGVAGHYAHFSHSVGRGGVGRAGPVGGLHDHILKFGRSLKAVVHQVQPRAGGGHAVSQFDDLFHTERRKGGLDNAAHFRPDGLHPVRPVFRLLLAVVEVVNLTTGRPDVSGASFEGRAGVDRVRQGVGCVQGSVQALGRADHGVQAGSHSVLDRKLCRYAGHFITCPSCPSGASLLPLPSFPSRFEGLWKHK